MSPVSERVRWPPVDQHQKTTHQEDKTVREAAKHVAPETETVAARNVVHAEPVRSVIEPATPVVNNQVSVCIVSHVKTKSLSGELCNVVHTNYTTCSSGIFKKLAYY